MKVYGVLHVIVRSAMGISPSIHVYCTPGYRFTKGLTQNLNLRTYLKLKYNIKSLNYIQPNLRFQASFLYYWTMSFTFSTWSVVYKLLQ